MSTKKEVVAEVVTNVIPKKPKTVLKSGLSYSLISRVRNALSQDVVKELDKGNQLTLVDGRGTEKVISEKYTIIAEQLGAKFLAGVKSSYIRPRIHLDKHLKVTMTEPEKTGINAPKTEVAETTTHAPKKLKKKVG